MTLPYIPSSKLIIVSGHFGSGKTNISVALALALKKSGKDVTLIDLDIVNPYFRAADAEELMHKNSIKCINPQFANTNVDVPSLGAEVRSVFSNTDPDSIAIFDVGGDNGAAALGQYKREFERIGYEMLCVVNKYRPLTDTPDAALLDLREIEYYARLGCTHLVNNSNLGGETDRSVVEESFGFADELAALSGLPLAFDSVVNAPFCRALVEDHPKRNIFIIENTTKKLF